MFKKDIFKKMFDEKFNDKKMHDEIIFQIERKKRFNFPKLLKYCLPIFILSLICGSLLLDNKKNILKSNANNSFNDEDIVNINNMSSMGAMRIDADIRPISNPNEYSDYMLNDLDLPKDFNNSIYNAVYVKDNNYILDEDDKQYSTTGYNVLNNFESIYENTSNDRQIIISFSNTNKPLRDYYFEKMDKVSKINNTNLVIYKYENSYLTQFNNQNVNYDIETHNIKEEELINLLKSIIK